MSIGYHFQSRQVYSLIYSTPILCLVGTIFRHLQCKISTLSPIVIAVLPSFKWLLKNSWKIVGRSANLISAKIDSFFNEVQEISSKLIERTDLPLQSKLSFCRVIFSYSLIHWASPSICMIINNQTCSLTSASLKFKNILI
jgi:hypothetical protein